MGQHHITVTKTARYFTLGNAENPTQVWFVCHGYTQLADQFVRLFAPVNDGTRLIVAPEGLSRFYTDHAARTVGAGWMTSEDRLAEIDDYVRYLNALYTHIFAEIDRAAVGCVVLGFSQGVATVCRWAVAGGVAVDRLVMWGGLLPPDLDLARHRQKLAESNLTIVLGSDDELVSSAARVRQEEELRNHTIPFSTILFEGGHRLDRNVLSQLVEV
ncbi:MAG: alpha/beta hydrolase [Gemmatimonadales bacterium]